MIRKGKTVCRNTTKEEDIEERKRNTPGHKDNLHKKQRRKRKLKIQQRRMKCRKENTGRRNTTKEEDINERKMKYIWK